MGMTQLPLLTAQRGRTPIRQSDAPIALQHRPHIGQLGVAGPSAGRRGAARRVAIVLRGRTM